MEQIGRYSIERPLARGGMAEVFLARADGPAGFSKRVVIKKMRPELADDSAFVEMFLNEARVAAQLSHPNIVQIFDFGEEHGQYFIAMEYVEGETARAINLDHWKRKVVLAPRLAVRVVSAVCEGLHYAHTLTDAQGQPLKLVHRDIGAENIIVSKSGVPKILDFGIAKTAQQEHLTGAGQIKGKYGYMSPEQLKGEQANPQFDVYAAGVTLYEMLAGRKPFVASNELELVRLILDGHATPLHQVNANVHPALSDIVANAIAPAEQRYASCHAFQSALEDFLVAVGQRATAADLGSVVEVVAARRKGAVVPELTPSNLRQKVSHEQHVATPTGVLQRQSGVTKRVADASGSKNEFEIDVASQTQSGRQRRETASPVPQHAPMSSSPSRASPASPRELTPPTPAGPRSSPSRVATPVEPDVPADVGFLRAHHRLVIGVAMVLVVVWTLAFLFRATNSADVQGERIAASAAEKTTPDAPVVVAPAAVAEARPQTPDVPTDEARVPAPPATPVLNLEPLVLNPENAPPLAPPQLSAARATGDGTLTVRASPWCEVFVDGAPLGSTPVVGHALTAGVHELRLKSPSLGAERVLKVNISSGQESVQNIIFKQGQLFVRSAARTEVFIDGKRAGQTPIDPISVVEGRHRVRLVNESLGKSEERVVDVKGGGRQLVETNW